MHPPACLRAGSWGVARDMSAGAAAQLTAGLLFTPIDIIKERMQVRGAAAAARHRGTAQHSAAHRALTAGAEHGQPALQLPQLLACVAQPGGCAARS